MEKEARHPNYLAIYIGLVVITAIEVTVSYLPFADKTPQTIILILGSICKAVLVMSFYMHLREDSRWYVLIVGLPLVIGALLSLTFVV
jgi:cytochrome c oxidase subunit IV